MTDTPKPYLRELTLDALLNDLEDLPRCILQVETRAEIVRRFTALEQDTIENQAPARTQAELDLAISEAIRLAP